MIFDQSKPKKNCSVAPMIQSYKVTLDFQPLEEYSTRKRHGIRGACTLVFLNNNDHEFSALI